MSHGTMESASARYRRNYNRLKDQHQCVSCAEKLPDVESFVRCFRCRGINKGDPDSPTRYSQRVALFRSQLARVIETSQTMTVQQQAADLGVQVGRIYALRNRARSMGHDFPREKGGSPPGFYNNESPRWKALDAYGACPRCHLRGPHECIPSIYEFAGQRRGPGRVYPTGGPGGVSVRAKAR